MADESAAPTNTTGWKNIVAGMAGGAGLVLAGHPLDTIKVRLQTQPIPPPGQPPMFTGMIDCMVKTVRNETVFGLYKGITPPLVGVPPQYAVVFLTYGWCQKLVVPKDHKGDLTVVQLMLAGAGSGILATAVTAPVDQIKARLQLQYNRPKGEPAEYSGPWDCTKKVVKQGGVGALFKGISATWLRDIPGSAAYFGGYELTKRMLAPKGGSTNDVGVLGLLFSGAMGGICNWLTILPADTVKTRMQTQPVGKPLYTGMIDCFAQLIRNEGIGALYKGLTPVLARAVPANAACFAAYEMTIRLLNKIA